jgi:hypothetical protein
MAEVGHKHHLFWGPEIESTSNFLKYFVEYKVTSCQQVVSCATFLSAVGLMAKRGYKADFAQFRVEIENNFLTQPD